MDEIDVPYADDAHVGNHASDGNSDDDRENNHIYGEVSMIWQCPIDDSFLIFR